MNHARKVLLSLAALGILAVPAVSAAGNRPAVPVGLHIAPVAIDAVQPVFAGQSVLAAQPVLTDKRQAKKVGKRKSLLGSPFGSFLMMLAGTQAGNALGYGQGYVSRGAN